VSAEHSATALTDIEVIGVAHRFAEWAAQLSAAEQSFMLQLVERAAAGVSDEVAGYLGALLPPIGGQGMSQLQNSNSQFSMVSNIMKTKHDTVKNSINNIR